MNKDLDALQRLKDTLLADGYYQDVLQDVSIIQQKLIALEIIKDKLPPLMRSALLDYCNKEEYDLLKEVLL